MVRGSGGRWRVRYRNFRQNNWANKNMKNSPLDWSINLLHFVVMELMPQECMMQGVGFRIHGGRGWHGRSGASHSN
jgi:hypothetical protein